MSRTYKHRPYKHTEYAKDREVSFIRKALEFDDYIVYYWTRDLSQVRKKRKTVDTEYHWQATP